MESAHGTVQFPSQTDVSYYYQVAAHSIELSDVSSETQWRCLFDSANAFACSEARVATDAVIAGLCAALRDLESSGDVLCLHSVDITPAVDEDHYLRLTLEFCTEGVCWEAKYDFPLTLRPLSENDIWRIKCQMLEDENKRLQVQNEKMGEVIETQRVEIESHRESGFVLSKMAALYPKDVQLVAKHVKRSGCKWWDELLQYASAKLNKAKEVVCKGVVQSVHFIWHLFRNAKRLVLGKSMEIHLADSKCHSC